MWIAHHKRIQLWHTARNILAIFYVWQLSFVYSCNTRFDDVQSKALLSQIVIVGKIHSLKAISSQQSQDYHRYIGVVHVLSVLKQPDIHKGDDIIYRKQYIEVDGFLSNSDRSSSNFSTAQDVASTTSATPPSTNHSCLAYVNLSQEYILYINRSTGGDSQATPTYHNAQLLSNYTKSDKKLVKDVLCEDCAKEPNAKSKRNLQVTEGASNYKINCRVEGNPPPDVRWYRGDTELDSTQRGIAIKHKRRKNVHTTSIRFKTVKFEHDATYKCVAENVLGSDLAKSRLTVMVDVNAPKPTPPPPGGGDWESVNVDEETIEPSHYIPCTSKDKNLCLHDGECRVLPDGRYKHCRCTPRYQGARCEEANLVPPTSKPTAHSVVWTTTSSIFARLELGSVVIALASVLVILVILMLIVAFYYAGWKYSSRQNKRLERHIQATPGYRPQEVNGLLEENESKSGHHQIAQCHTTASQTNPVETSLQQLRRSLNLENHFPHTSDVVLRRQSLGAGSGRPGSRPGSHPVDRRLTRSRLSGTSTLTESKRVIDSEFDVLAERTPSSASLELNITGSASSCNDNSNSHTHSHRNSAEINSLHISESTLGSNESDKRRKSTKPDKYSHASMSPNNPPVTDKNANAKNYTFNRYNGAV